ncbi:hypothetical protein COY90_04795 [Candidatus Roizmanbacteria bacterium CG_4_10_14_0_8_um_filter_39_9]|uniref:Cohesin domain-containing protein n=1 Tax=Candidatus Roizmanbacteria bacterium CG_4_10_14_0_8_um_filter_39_9 TaxID=1974829 RepID=A0A2M7QCP5_9BACT|nr:MAG: hypothetical protein COY90_04795 [Candidatus Roizmanbacteria bacterium CG_4_10_14_0_8_um_filter_39_9]
MSLFKRPLFVFIAVAIFLSIASPVHAVKFELVPPSGQLSRGQEVTFTINIDTQGASLSTIQTGLTYDTQFLEYVSAAAGATMDSLSVDTSLGGGKLVLTGTNAADFTGAGVYATVVFKIIAQESGSTELCTLWTPSPTPTLPPDAPTATPLPPPPPTVPPPTALPQTGFGVPKTMGTIAGILFIAVAGGVFFYTKKSIYTTHTPSRATPHTKQESK